MNDLMSRLLGNPRSAELAASLPNLPVVWSAPLAADSRPQGATTLKGTFNPRYGRAQGVDGPRARRAADADAMRRWMFDPTPEQCPRKTEREEEVSA